uniref:Uncharacterized protein n=1 Tax=Trypanosoma vivax (strain Y486) TaxID=1055687 RepID=G0U9A5_TRYVY|nr:conserved hypothetical protein, fragment [Trypanosoma vivax Y486]
MSRADKRHHRDFVVGTSKDEAVRLYAFANTRPGYRVIFSPKEPLIVLKTKKSTDGRQHPCTQWAPLASILFTLRPSTTHAMYVVDTTSLSQTMEREESVAPTGGPVVKRLSNVLAKLNPCDAVMVAAGVSASLAFKYVVTGEKSLGHSSRLVRRLLLVCPPSAKVFAKLMGEMAKRGRRNDYPKPELLVLLPDKDHVGEWQGLLGGTVAASLIESWSVSSNLQPSLFAAIAREAGVGADGTTVKLETHYADPRVFRIDFILSKDTKKTEQRVTLSPLTSNGHDDEAAEDSSLEGEGDAQGACGECRGVSCEDESSPSSQNETEASGEENQCNAACSSRRCCAAVVSGLTSLSHCKLSVPLVVEGRVMDSTATTIGTTQGRVTLKGLRDALKSGRSSAVNSEELTRGSPIRVECHVQRDDAGRTTLKVLKASFLTKVQARRSMTVCPMSEVPSYNVSAVAHNYGTLLIRGRKCVLVRSLNGEFDGMRIPWLPHSSTKETSLECAERALCERCDVSPDNFYMPNYLSPVSYYERSTEDDTVFCYTIFVAFAVTPASGGADGVEDAECPSEPYRLLRSGEEREVLGQIKSAVQRAYMAGLYIPLNGMGVFGEDVADIVDTAATPRVELPPLGGLELLVICAPGMSADYVTGLICEIVTNVVVRISEASQRTEIEQTIAASLSAESDRVVLCLEPDADIGEFSEEELIYWSSRGARPRVITLLDPQLGEQIISCDQDVALHHFVHSVMISDALVTINNEVQQFTAHVWGLLKLAHALNDDLALYSGLVARHPISPPASPLASGILTPSSESGHSLHEISVHRSERPIVASRLAPLLDDMGLEGCYKHATLLWAHGEVWQADRPDIRGVLALNSLRRCLVLEEGSPWDNECRSSFVTLYVWATTDGRTELEKIINILLDSMLSDPTEAL